MTRPYARQPTFVADEAAVGVSEAVGEAKEDWVDVAADHQSVSSRQSLTPPSPA